MAYRDTLIATVLAVLIAGSNDSTQPLRSLAKSEWSRSELIRKLQPGDIVFRHGVGDLSEIVSQASAYAGRRKTRWTHVGIAVRIRPDGQTYILHAIDGRGVTLDTPERFFSSTEAADGAMMRIKDGEAAANHAMQYLGRPFDTDFSLRDHSALYCTELILTAMADVGIAVDVPARRVPIIGNAIVFPDDLADAVNRMIVEQ